MTSATCQQPSFLFQQVAECVFVESNHVLFLTGK